MALTSHDAILASLAKTSIPNNLHYGLANYIAEQYQPGGFLTSVLENDLVQAVSNGDEDSQDALVKLVKWLYQFAPGDCWGSPEKVRQWLTPPKD